jgi:prepilin-type processing-associated H-X9-DG protein
VLYHLLPFIEQQNIYKLHENSDHFTDVNMFKIGVLLCPGDPSWPAKFPPANYSPNYHVFQNEPGGSQGLQNIADGTSNTIAFCERRITCKDGGGSWSKRDPRFGAWVKSTAVFQSNIEPPNAGDNSRWHEIHKGGINVLLCDGGVFFKGTNINKDDWRKFVLIDDGPPASFD